MQEIAQNCPWPEPQGPLLVHSVSWVNGAFMGFRTLFGSLEVPIKQTLHFENNFNFFFVSCMGILGPGGLKASGAAVKAFNEQSFFFFLLC